MPGEELSVIEEFTTGEGTYEFNGTVYSSVVGKAFYDMINRKVNSIGFKKPGILSLKKSKYVLGIVVGIKEDSAIINIQSLEDKSLVTTLSGYIHISQISSKYLNTISDAMRVGDIIRAKPINYIIPVPLTIKQRDLGVISAKCSICGSPLQRQDEEHLKCPDCGNIETRKLAFTVKKGGN
ncbi:conserved Archaeal protein [Sulfolobus acidocaldarius DSM 639]|uniref:Exosome complex component Csl4 n=1 Tax=Sulfolobus acidocaldarius (strain ATCC 33909 / DSM 639 / JCM 8929 / NBRC 15157 / NCIMB 11770) TaxID=330779 RepID=Q4JC86_SULAC|nr:conserved Archaeal protein [Sulfolobus acidocaldarius DSM 639]